MKKINKINIVLMLILLFCFLYDIYETNKNLSKLENKFIQNYNNWNFKNLAKENEELTRIFKLDKMNDKISVVRGYFINPYHEYIINKGKSENIEDGFAVINEHRLVGFIKKTYNNFSNVELLENLEKTISIKVNDKYGFLQNKNNSLIISGIDEKNLKIGDLVYTSGLTKIPENIYIGKINKIVEKDDTFETIAYISIDQNYNKYKYLVVIMQ